MDSTYLVQTPGRTALTTFPPPPGIMAATEMVTMGRADPAYRIIKVEGKYAGHYRPAIPEAVPHTVYSTTQLHPEER